MRTNRTLASAGPHAGHKPRLSRVTTGRSRRSTLVPAGAPDRDAYFFQAGHASSILVTRSTTRQGRPCREPLECRTSEIMQRCLRAAQPPPFWLSTTWLSRAAISRARRSVACWYISAAAIVEWPIRCISSRVEAPLGAQDRFLLPQVMKVKAARKAGRSHMAGPSPLTCAEFPSFGGPSCPREVPWWAALTGRPSPGTWRHHAAPNVIRTSTGPQSARRPQSISSA